jgi:threonine/homoserine/homoserine lactone efflux protein
MGGDAKRTALTAARARHFDRGVSVRDAIVERVVGLLLVALAIALLGG